MRGRIETTEAKAREIAPMVERLITKAKAGTPVAERNLSAVLPKNAATKLVTTIAPNLKDRKGGYTRIIKLEPRSSDASRTALIEILQS